MCPVCCKHLDFDYKFLKYIPTPCFCWDYASLLCIPVKNTIFIGLCAPRLPMWKLARSGTANPNKIQDRLGFISTAVAADCICKLSVSCRKGFKCAQNVLRQEHSMHTLECKWLLVIMLLLANQTCWMLSHFVIILVCIKCWSAECFSS